MTTFEITLLIHALTQLVAALAKLIKATRHRS